MTSAAIDLSNVEKTYRGRIRALRGVQMRVEKGEVFGLLGPNGAGKSTLVKILTSVVHPTRCTGTLLDAPIGDKKALARVGYLPENPRFPDYLTGGQVLDLFGALAKIPRAERRRRADDLLATVGMTKWARTKIGRYSKGMRQRIGLAQALMNDPEIVFLDEPTDGVDPVGRREIREMLVRMRDDGRTVMLNSHLLSEAETVCGRVAIMVKGKVVRHGALDDLTRHSRRYEIEAAGPLPSGDHWRSLVHGLGAEVRSLGGAPREASLVVAPTDEPEPIQALLDALRAARAVVRSVRPVRASLEDLFLEAVQSMGEEGAGVGGQKGRDAAGKGAER
ncbi:MAG: ABC transporter ATP-binding protein [Phycisphaerales bacterium]|nr:ABC transporter ATP-binding protein [Phycisphaerales bacterium]